MGLDCPILDSDIYDCLDFVNLGDPKIMSHFCGYAQYDGMPGSWKLIRVAFVRR